MRRASIVVLVLSVAAWGPPAGASDPPECGTVWSSDPATRACTFLAKGLPIEIRGEATAQQDAAVRVWIHPIGYPELVVLECADNGGSRASCSSRLDPATVVLPRQFPHVVFQCNVSGRAAGTYHCESDLGP